MFLSARYRPFAECLFYSSHRTVPFVGGDLAQPEVTVNLLFFKFFEEFSPN
jgi:hypothetical protein